MRGESVDPLFDYALARLSAERGASPVNCKICDSRTELFDVVDFKKCCSLHLYPNGLAAVPVYYRSCAFCGFIFTIFFDQFTAEQWRLFIYNDRYAEVDPEYQNVRSHRNVSEIQCLLARRKNQTIGLDYGGGNGLTAALLRQKGWFFDTYDPYGHSDLEPSHIRKYNFCSAFEVFEHSPDPISTLSEVVKMASPDHLMICIGTGAHDAEVQSGNRLGWWYAAPRNGHVSLYSRRSLNLLGQRFGLTYVSISPGTHLLLRMISEREARLQLLRAKLLGRLNRILSRA